MANFENPLDKFRSHSYYHVLVVCSNTTAAETLQNSSALLETGRQNQSIEEKYKVKGINSNGESVNIDPNSTSNPNIQGKYVILFNGSTDAEFVIDSVRWTNLISPAENDPNTYTTIAVEGEMDIQEPRGARFLNIINNAIRQMGIEVSAVAFMLKTVFVGAGIGETISNIPPLIFVLYDMEATFDIVGANYTLNFMTMNNGAAKMQQFNGAANTITSLKIPKNASLAQVITLYNANINTAYVKYANKVILESGQVSEDFRYLVYNISVDDIYSDDEKKYQVDQFKDQNQDSTEGDAVIAFGDTPTIESSLNLIMKHCGGVLDDGKGNAKPEPVDAQGTSRKDNRSVKYMYKIISSFESFDTAIIINYRIVRYAAPTTSIIEKAQNGDLEDEALLNNALLLDYIWTGKNIDVLQFDMKMAMGLSFLQIVTTTNNLPTDNSATASDKAQSLTNAGATLIAGETSGASNLKTVIYFPKSNDKPEAQNTKRPTSAVGFNQLLGKFAALGQVEARVVIRGNPTFLANLTPLPSETSSGKVKKEGNEVAKKEFANFERAPALCKINIKMPKPNQAHTTNEGIQEYESFWYQGYYYIFSIENVFDGGVFTQVLDIQSLPNDLKFLENEEVTGKKDDSTTSTATEVGTVPVSEVAGKAQ